MLSKKFTIITILSLVSLALIGQNNSSDGLIKPSNDAKIIVTNNSPSDATSKLENFSADISNEIVEINWNLNNVNDMLWDSNCIKVLMEWIGKCLLLLTVNETEDNTFQYVDETPNWGVNFYRIKLLNMNGDYTFFRTTKVVFEYETGADVGDFFPNPTTTGNTNLNINIPDSGLATIYIHDGMGKLV